MKCLRFAKLVIKKRVPMRIVSHQSSMPGLEVESPTRLGKMEDMADGEDNKSVRPNVYVYASVLNACIS